MLIAMKTPSNTTTAIASAARKPGAKRPPFDQKWRMPARASETVENKPASSKRATNIHGAIDEAGAKSVAADRSATFARNPAKGGRPATRSAHARKARPKA